MAVRDETLINAGRDKDRAPDERSESKGADWLGETRSIIMLLLAVLAFHSLIAKPFYIPSESMMPCVVERRQAGRQQISLWLVLCQPQLSYSAAHQRPAIWPHAGTRRHRHRNAEA